MSGLVESSADARSKTIGQNFRVRAWVNFNGAGDFSTNPSTAAIRSSGNVSSITFNATGDYTVNFTTAMPDANYAVSSVQGFVANAEGADATVNVNRNNNSGTEVVPTTTALRVNSSNDAGSPADMKYVNIIVVA